MQHTSEKISVTVPTETSVAEIQVIFRILFPEKNRSKKFQFQNALRDFDVCTCNINRSGAQVFRFCNRVRDKEWSKCGLWSQCGMLKRVRRFSSKTFGTGVYVPSSKYSRSVSKTSISAIRPNSYRSLLNLGDDLKILNCSRFIYTC